MADTNCKEKPRFTETEYEVLLTKLANIFAGIEAEWHALASGEAGDLRGRHLDTIQVLAQSGGFIADYAASDCGCFGDIYYWLQIPQAGVES